MYWCCTYCWRKKNVFWRNPYPGSGLIAERIPQTQEIAPHSDEVILKHVGNTRIPKKSSNANLNLSQHIANRVLVPLSQTVDINMVLTWGGRSTKKSRHDVSISLGKKSGRQQLQKTLHTAVWRRKRDVFICKLVRHCNTKVVLIWTRNLEVPELKAETLTWRPRFWNLEVHLVRRTYWNYQLWLDTLTGNVFPSLGEGTTWIFFSSKSDANNVSTLLENWTIEGRQTRPW